MPSHNLKIGSTHLDHADFKKGKKYSGFANSHNNQIYRINTDFNESLTLNRIININNTLKKINDEINETTQKIKDQPTQNTDVIVRQCLTKLQSTLVDSKSLNTDFNRQYGKNHQTYKENRVSGRGYFAAWWNKSWRQSKANIKLDKSLYRLSLATKSFEKTFSTEPVVKTPPLPSAPPAYK